MTQAQASERFKNIIIKNRDIILSSKQREDLIVIQPKMLDSILSKVELEKKEAIEILKGSLRSVLKLHERDAIVTMGDKLLIRIFNHDSSKPPTEGVEKRFNGLPPEELNQIYIKISKKINFAEEIKKIAQEALKEELNIEKINNFIFAPLFVKVFQTKIATYLKSAINEEQYVIDGLINFIFRKFFDSVLFLISEHYINQMINNNKAAIDFIEFYNGDTITKPDGNRVQKPFFTDTAGNRINRIIIMQVGMAYRKGVEAYRFFHQKLKGFESQIENFKTEINTLSRDIAQNETELKDALEKANSSLVELKELKNELMKLKTAKASLDQINPITIKVRSLTVEEDNLFKNRKRLESEVEKLKIKLVNVNKELEATQRVYDKERQKSEQMKATYMEQKSKFDDIITKVGSVISKFRG